MASTIVACSAGTAIVASGRASATRSAAQREPVQTAIGACRRQPGLRGSAEARTAGLAKASAAAAPPLRDARTASAASGTSSSAEQEGGRLEAHGVRVLGGCSGRWPSVTSTVCSEPPRVHRHLDAVARLVVLDRLRRRRRGSRPSSPSTFVTTSPGLDAGLRRPGRRRSTRRPGRPRRSGAALGRDAEVGVLGRRAASRAAGSTSRDGVGRDREADADAAVAAAGGRDLRVDADHAGRWRRAAGRRSCRG